MLQHRDILGLPIVASNYKELAEDSLEWARQGQSKAICFVTVHGVMEAYDDPRFHQLYASADMLNPDGMPLVLGLRLFGVPNATRVYGPDSTVLLLAAAEENETLEKLLKETRRRWPALRTVFVESPPFRPLTAEEDAAMVKRVTDSGTRFLFVGLGCPKQEEWVVLHRGQIPAVLLAVGAAFDFLAGTKPQAPRWMMKSGLEWLFRLASEPRRLFKRYFKHNIRFVYFFARQWIRYRRTA
jgi:N-acetylglucosaminyldiphosphoundecaprenol N-acetyl-beta-D-mannosaminyltransferase